MSPHYFRVFKIPLLRGRAFTETDTGASARVVIINDAMAKKYWPKEDALGQQILIGKGLGPQFEEPSRQIVGIVGNVRENGLGNAGVGVMYVPQSQMTEGLTALANSVIPLSWCIRTATDPSSLRVAIERELHGVDGQMPISRERTMTEVLAGAVARQSFNMVLLSIFAGVALVLAAIGIYGLMSYSVDQRRQEIGIRMALGADRGRMLRVVLREGMTLAVLGVVLGLLLAYGLTRLLASLLFGVKASDPFAFAAVAGILTMVALVAAYIPARRATTVDPAIALRYRVTQLFPGPELAKVSEPNASVNATAPDKLAPEFLLSTSRTVFIEALNVGHLVPDNQGKHQPGGSARILRFAQSPALTTQVDGLSADRNECIHLGDLLQSRTG